MDAHELGTVEELATPKDWSDFLTRAGAVWEDARVGHFGNVADEQRRAIDGNVTVDLSHFGLIAVTGADGDKLLQGQFTNDVSNVSGSQSQLSAWCSIKGRIVVSIRLLRHADTLYVQLPAESIPAVLPRLRMYVLRSDVRLEDASGRLARIGVSGPNVPAALSAVVDEVPNGVEAAVQHDGVTVIKLPGIAPRYEIIGTAERVEALWSTLGNIAAPAGAGAWTLLDIMAGIPTIHPAIADEFVPQMVNLDAINAVSFTKGCYTGQEIVARTQHLGRIKRRMYLTRVDADNQPAAGETIFGSAPDTSQAIGKVVNAAQHPDGGYALLAVAQISAAEHEELHLGSPNGLPLTLIPLPYSIGL